MATSQGNGYGTESIIMNCFTLLIPLDSCDSQLQLMYSMSIYV